MRRQMEDLDNRSEQCILRVRGMPEPNGPEDVELILTSLFRAIVGEAVRATFDFVRAYVPYACGQDNFVPRDIICYFCSFKQKETIILKA
ncbi:Hypothetical predicted protein [Pelobates cultripes]|uniref:Uncharacterized protein n=1 Tax=Pelobates cultripes TaxID=61616 RepID=A0AAD1R6C4_PELCU|nr:Hypothetical predicted protein [Pelobates cultripes]